MTINPSAIEAYMPLEGITFKGGAGTNVLVFEGTAAKNFKNTTWGGDGVVASGTNKELMKIKPINGGTVKDMKDKETTFPQQ